MDDKTIDKAIKSLERNNFQTTLLERKEDIVPYLGRTIEKGSSVSMGGCMTVIEAGGLELLRNGDYDFLDRAAPGADIRDIYIRSFDVDYYLASANAITENGELLFIDGNGNRVAAVTYGPRRVIIIASTDKICKDIDDAVLRMKTVACPKNTVRLSLDTPCRKDGKCFAVKENEIDTKRTYRCKNSICNFNLIVSGQRQKGRISVILVNDRVGY